MSNEREIRATRAAVKAARASCICDFVAALQPQVDKGEHEWLVAAADAFLLHGPFPLRPTKDQDNADLQPAVPGR